MDIDPRKSEAAKDTIETKQDRENIHFISADAAKLPFSENSIHEIYFGNVFGDPHISNIQRQEFLNDAFRVLDKDGALIIRESTTPADFPSLLAILREKGFLVNKVIRPKIGYYHGEYRNKDPEWEKAIAPFNKRLSSYGTSHYLIYAKKIVEDK